MHILELPSFFTPYGGEFCLEQAKALQSLGHEVRILSNVQLGLSISKLRYFTSPYGRFWHKADGVAVFQTLMRGYPRLVHRNMERWVAVVRSMFADYVRLHGKPDVVHAHCAKWAGYAAMQISRKYGIPYVITEHLSKLVFEKEFGLAPSDTWQIALLKECYHEAKMVVPVSEELVDNIACYFGKDYRWQAISNTIDVDFFHYQKRSPREGRAFRFCCLANFWPLKGYEVLIPAFGQLLASGVNAELHIAGRKTDSAVCRSVLTDGIITHGLLDKTAVRELLYHCDALVLASRSEVQPLVLLEAMSTGIPVIATECIPKSLRIEGGCTIVPVDGMEALIEAMKSMVQQSAFDGKAVSEKVRQMASPEVIGRQLSTLFTDILASS